WAAGDPLVDLAAAPAREIILQPGEESDAFEAEGPGMIRGIRILARDMEARTPPAAHLRDQVWLIAHFDDDEPRDPSIRAPIGPMFLDYGQSPAPRSLFAGTDRDGYYCFFPMPYRERTRIKIITDRYCRSPYYFRR